MRTFRHQNYSAKFRIRSYFSDKTLKKALRMTHPFTPTTAQHPRLFSVFALRH